MLRLSGRILRVVMMSLALLPAVRALAQSVFDPVTADNTAAVGQRWVMAFDNDFLVPGGRDQDYTYGLNINYSGSGLQERSWLKPLAWLDDRLGLPAAKYHGVEFGLYGFTPEDIEVAEANPNDRPYASLVYAAATAERIQPWEGRVVRSQLSLGVLGLSIVGNLQASLHSAIDSQAPKGWDHQIADGGELTARYRLSRQTLAIAESGLEIKATQSASVGYITEASIGLNMRAGRFNSPWHRFNPDLASYAETSAQVSDYRHEHFFWFGFALKARAYNAFLQGQFRDSDVTYDFDQLNHVLLEVWTGYTIGFDNGAFISYGLRGHTSEVRRGDADRSVLWGGLMIGRQV